MGGGLRSWSIEQLALILCSAGELSLFASVVHGDRALALFVGQVWAVRSAVCAALYAAAYAAAAAPATAVALVACAQAFSTLQLPFFVCFIMYNDNVPRDGGAPAAESGARGRGNALRRCRDAWTRATRAHAFVPVDIDHVATRLGELVMLVIGESVIGCVQACCT